MGDRNYPDDPIQDARDEMRRLRQAIHGDPAEGIPGLRGRIDKLEEELDRRVEQIENKLDEAQVERDRLNWRLSMVSGTLKWLGPSGVMLIIGFIAYVLRQSPA